VAGVRSWEGCKLRQRSKGKVRNLEAQNQWWECRRFLGGCKLRQRSKGKVGNLEAQNQWWECRRFLGGWEVVGSSLRKQCTSSGPDYVYPF